MLAVRYADGSEQVLVLTDLLTGRSYGIDDADLSEPVREWIRRTTLGRKRPGSDSAAPAEATAR